MRTAGVFLIGIGLLIAVVFALLPASADSALVSGNCGPPALRLLLGSSVSTDAPAEVTDACRRVAIQRLLVSAGVLAVAVAYGLVMIAVGAKE